MAKEKQAYIIPTFEVANKIVSESEELRQAIFLDLDTYKGLKAKNIDVSKLHENVLEIKNLHLYFKTHGHDNHVIRGINLNIKRGETFAIVGESGSGKSVFTKTFSGMNDDNSKIKSGSIKLIDIPIETPSLLHRNLDDNNRRKDTLLKMQYNSAEQKAERELKALEAKLNKSSQTIVKDINNNNKEYLVESYISSLDNNLKKRLEYLDLYYSDHINAQLNKEGEYAIRRQTRISSLSNKVNKVFHVREISLGTKEVKSFIAERYNNLKDSSEVKSLISRLDELKGQLDEMVSSNSDQQNLKIRSTASSLIKEMKVCTNRLKTLFTNELNSILEVLKSKPLDKDIYVETYGEGAKKQAEENKALFIDLYKDAFDLDLLSETPTVDETDEERSKAIATFVETVDSTFATRIFSLGTVDIKNQIELVKTEVFERSSVKQKREQIATLLSKKDVEENKTKALSLHAEIRSLYLETVDKLLNQFKLAVTDNKAKELQIDKETHKLSLDNYMSVIDIYSEGYDFGYDILLELSSIIVNALYGLRDKDVLAANTLKETSLEQYTSKLDGQHSEMESKLSSSTSLLDERKKSNEQILEEKKAELDARVKKVIKENQVILNNPLFSDEEREFFKSFTSKDLQRIVDAKLKLVGLLLHKQEVIDSVTNIKRECLKAFINYDERKVQELSFHLGLSSSVLYSDIRKNEKKTSNLELNIGMRREALKKDDPKYEVQMELLDTEYKSKLNMLKTEKELLFNKVKHIISNANVEKSYPMVALNQEIFETRNLVSNMTAKYRNRTRRSSYDRDLVRKLEKKNIVVDNTIDLAKLKTNKQWSIIRGSKIATIFQDPMTSLNPLLTIGEQISEVLRLHHKLSKKEAKKETLSLLAKVRIPEPEKRYKEYPFQYSGGMRQRVVIAIALACRPDILICDEPTTALDVTVQAQILKLISELQKDYHFTTIFITHDLGVVAGVADRIGVMYGGQIVEYGTDEDIFYRPAHPYTWALLSSLPQLAKNNEPLVYIKGNPPSFSTEIEGDAFAPRSEYAMKIDFIQEPPMQQISETHFAKTWLLDKRAPKVKKPLIIRNLEERIQQTAKDYKLEEDEDYYKEEK